MVYICVLLCQDLSLSSPEDSTNDIAQLLGMLDPWYERNTLSLLDLPVGVVSQVRNPMCVHAHT